VFQQQQQQAIIVGCQIRKHLKRHRNHSILFVIGSQGSLASDIPTSPGSTARGLAARINTQIPSGPGSPDDSCQSSWSDHHRPDLASDEVPYLCANCPEQLAGCIRRFEDKLFCMYTDTLLSQCAYACLFVMWSSVVAAGGHPESYSACTGVLCRMRLATLGRACQEMITKRVP